ncbi:histidine phosphatase family protein [Candidatus Beckwithbacteria bacterium]|nr:histidine phosphatase family protein [Candidatus Beckwithbacteria bacterium]
MAQTIYFVRHGQKEKHPGDPSLTDLGIRQAKATANYFKDKTIDALYSSPLLRTKETAQYINVNFGLNLIIEQRLYERLNWGDRKGETFEEFWQLWQKTDLDRNFKPPKSRSSNQTGRDVLEFCNQVLADKNIKSILMATHGGTIGDFLRIVFDNSLLPTKTNPENQAQYIEVNECSITEVEKHGSNYILKRLNDTSHLI